MSHMLQSTCCRNLLTLDSTGPVASDSIAVHYFSVALSASEYLVVSTAIMPLVFFTGVVSTTVSTVVTFLFGGMLDKFCFTFSQYHCTVDVPFSTLSLNPSTKECSPLSLMTNNSLVENVRVSCLQ